MLLEEVFFRCSNQGVLKLYERWDLRAVLGSQNVFALQRVTSNKVLTFDLRFELGCVRICLCYQLCCFP